MFRHYYIAARTATYVHIFVKYPERGDWDRKKMSINVIDGCKFSYNFADPPLKCGYYLCVLDLEKV